MQSVITVSILVLAAGVSCWSQQDSSQLSPRTLFYFEQPDADKLPVAPTVKSAKPVPKQDNSGKGKDSKAGSGAPSTAAHVPAPLDPTPPPSVGAPVIPLVEHLGLRYNVLLVNSGNGAVDAADPDRVFNPEDCIAFEFEPNRSGYLYVYEQASSGNWYPLFPSTLLEGESNVVTSRTTRRVPAKDCFEVSGPAGLERVFVVLSRNVEDLYALNDSMKAASDVSAPNAAPRTEPNRPTLDSQLLSDQINRMRAGLENRELRLKKVPQPEGPGERPNAVYVVNALQTDRIVTEIHIMHR